MEPETVAWATDEFGRAELGDVRRTARLVKMAGAAAESPGGLLTGTFQTDAELEGAYRFVENAEVSPQEVGRAMFRATAARCTDEVLVIVPVDGSNITVSWAAGTEEFGPVGSSSQGSRGVEVMNAIAVRPDGTPLGVVGQQWWVRAETSDKTGKRKPRNRPLHKKETQHWFHCVNRAESAFAEEAPATQRWYQLDAGADFGEMLHWMSVTQAFVTARAAQDRRLLSDDDDTTYLWEIAGGAPCLGSFTLPVSAGPKRQARDAVIELRAVPVSLKVRGKDRRFHEVQLTAVLALEVGTNPEDEEPIEWLLLTNRTVTSCEEAREVVRAYSLRWRVEAFHKTWKAVCGAEDGQLRSPLSVILWCTILAGVAMRVDRLSHLARTQPDTPATEELTREEIDATIVLQSPTGYERGDTPTLSVAVEWIARQGGYRGKSSGGPPGTVVIGRGLRRVEIAAEVLRQIDRGS